MSSQAMTHLGLAYGSVGFILVSGLVIMGITAYVIWKKQNHH